MRHVLRAPGGRSEVTLHQGEEGGSKLTKRSLFTFRAVSRLWGEISLFRFRSFQCRDVWALESPSRLLTVFYVIVVFLVTDRSFWFWSCSWMLFDLSIDMQFCRVDASCSGVTYLWFCFFCFCCVLFCVLLWLLLVVLLVVLEFENGRREEELLLFCVS